VQHRSPAGRQILSIGAAAEALAHLTRVLELWEVVVEATTLVGQDHPGLLLEATLAAEHARHLDRAIDLTRKAAAELASVDPVREGEALLLLRNLYRFTSRWDECADAVARTLAVIPNVPPSKARAHALAAASLGHGYANLLQEALTHVRQSVAVAEAVGDTEALIDSYNALGNALYNVGDYEGGFAVASRGLDLCETPVSPERVLTAYICMDNVLFGARPLPRSPRLRSTRRGAGTQFRAQRSPKRMDRRGLGRLAGQCRTLDKWSRRPPPLRTVRGGHHRRRRDLVVDRAHRRLDGRQHPSDHPGG
jgi:tetratricopeptide (TPR) repeat protein